MEFGILSNLSTVYEIFEVTVDTFRLLGDFFSHEKN